MPRHFHTGDRSDLRFQTATPHRIDGGRWNQLPICRLVISVLLLCNNSQRSASESVGKERGPKNERPWPLICIMIHSAVLKQQTTGITTVEYTDYAAWSLGMSRILSVSTGRCRAEPSTWPRSSSPSLRRNADKLNDAEDDLPPTNDAAKATLPVNNNLTWNCRVGNLEDAPLDD